MFPLTETYQIAQGHQDTTFTIFLIICLVIILISALIAIFTIKK